MNARTRNLETVTLGTVPATTYDPEGTRELRVDLMFIDRRGYYASANVQTVRGHTVSFMPFSAVTVKVEESSRFSAKRLASIVVPSEVLENIKCAALIRNNERGA